MDIKELNEKLGTFLNPVKEDASTIDAQKLNMCIDCLYDLERLALEEAGDKEIAQAIKDARIYAEDVRREKIMGMGESVNEEYESKEYSFTVTLPGTMSIYGSPEDSFNYHVSVPMISWSGNDIKAESMEQLKAQLEQELQTETEGQFKFGVGE